MALWHYYWREGGKGLAPSIRAAQLYDSVTIRDRKEQQQGAKEPQEVTIRPMKQGEGVMPQESTREAKSMSYEVNPECDMTIYQYRL